MRGYRLTILGLAALTGCLGQSKYRPIHSYDLQTQYSSVRATLPPAIPVGAVVAVDQFRMIGPAESRLMFRQSDHRLHQDEYHRWIQPPEQCVAKEFHMAIRRRFRVAPSGGPPRVARLLGSIITLEATQEQTAHLVIELRLIDDATGKRLLSEFYERREPIANSKPEAFADAMAKALESVIEEALQDMAKVVGG